MRFSPRQSLEGDCRRLPVRESAVLPVWTRFIEGAACNNVNELTEVCMGPTMSSSGTTTYSYDSKGNERVATLGSTFWTYTWNPSRTWPGSVMVRGPVFSTSARQAGRLQTTFSRVAWRLRGSSQAAWHTTITRMR